LECHRRTRDDKLDVKRLPPLLQTQWLAHEQCVYVRLEPTRRLEELL